MDVKEIKELIELINTSDLAYFEVSTNGTTIKMDKSLTRNSRGEAVSESSNKEIKTIIENKVNVDNEILSDMKVEENVDFIKSPMVGTFYSSPSPEKSAFVSVGDRVTKGRVLCIVEAMKLMNEIEAEVEGEVLEILVKDGDMVEYSQPIFKIRRG